MGAGKSTLGRQLSARLGHPFASVDAMLFGAGWRRRPRSESHPELRAFVGGERWVLDNAGYDLIEERIAAATTILVLDYARPVCLAGMVVRFLSRRRTAPGLPPRLTWWMVRSVWKWPTVGRSRMRGFVDSAARGAELVVLRSRTEAAHWLEAAAPSGAAVTAFEDGGLPDSAF